MSELLDTLQYLREHDPSLFTALFVDERPVKRDLLSAEQLDLFNKYSLLTGEKTVRSTRRFFPLENDFLIATDHVSYQGDEHNEGMVMPFHPENPYLLDEMRVGLGDCVLEIGVGSGVNAIYALKQGAQHVTALDVNPRAKEFTQFNAQLYDLSEGKLEVRLNESYTLADLFNPVADEQFDYIITNPPFEYGRVEESDALKNSASGIDGLDMVREIVSQADTYLVDGGHLQMVFFSPGTQEGPTELISIAKQLADGKVEIKYRENCMKTADFVAENLGKRMDIPAKHEFYWTGMLHYTKGGSGFNVTADGVAKNWNLPLGSRVPMLHKHGKMDDVYTGEKK